MVDGYRTQEEIAKEKRKKSAETLERSEAALQAAIQAFDEAACRLRRSSIPPDCVIEFGVSRWWNGGRATWKRRGAAWHLGGFYVPESGLSPSYTESYALGVDGNLYRGRTELDRKAFCTGERYDSKTAGPSKKHFALPWPWEALTSWIEQKLAP